MGKAKLKKILFVDNEAYNLTLEVKTLQGLGYNVITAHNGDEALKLTHSDETISLVIIDIELDGGMDGAETARQILKYRFLPIIFLAENSNENAAEKVRGIPGYGLVIKNSSSFVLQSTVEMAFNLYETTNNTKASDKKYLDYFYKAPHGFFVADGKANYLEINEEACKMTGYSREELMAMTILDLIPPEFHNDAQKHFANVIANGKASGTLGYVKKDGSLNYWIVDAVKLQDNRIIGIVTDITQQKNDEFELIKTRKMYEEERNILDKIIELNPYPMQILDNRGYTIKSNKALIELFGAAPPKDHCIYDDPFLKKENMIGNIEKIAKGGVVHFPIIYYNVHDVDSSLPDKPIWLKTTGFSVFDEDNMLEKIILLHEDVTEREFALKSLKESEKRFRSSLANAPIGISIINMTGEVEYINEKFTQIFGYTLKDCKTVDDWWQIAYPDPVYRAEIKMKWFRAMDMISRNEINVYTEEFQIYAKDRKYLNVEISLTLNGNSWLVLFNDITARIKAEEAIREKDLLFKTVFNTVSDAIFITGYPDGTIVECNDKLGGYSKEDLIGKSTIGVGLWTIPSDREKVVSLMNEKAEVKDFETEFRRKDGNTFVGSISTNFIEIKGKKYFVSVVRNVSERKKAEEALQLERNIIDAIFNSVPGMIYLYNEEAKLIKWNKKHIEMSGYSAEELYGKGVIDWYKDDEASIKSIQEGLSKTLVEGFGEAEADLQRKDGTRIPMYFTAVPITIAGKTYFTGIGIDITARKNAENTVKDLLNEKELLLKEVHHRIKNNMGTIVNLLNLQAESSNDKKVVEALTETKNRILSMQVLYDKLYRSDKVNKLSLFEYVSPLVDEIIKTFPNYKTVQVEKSIEDIFIDPKILSSLGIIINELITNIMKYAFPGFSKGLINISSALNGTEITFIISDSGIGIPESISLESSTGFGLRLVRLLTMQLRGNMVIKRDKGTKFILKFNI